ncbi:cellulose biosynthesis protein BcsN [Acuticoccus sp.]|uniref:cellulose biosynthesis protein BcsN n=1 Tax=Acuticoccus sp. TaxID=1904378 RepID=UPI003B52DED6
MTVLAMVLVGGCSSAPHGGVVRSATLEHALSPSEAFISPPPGGPGVIAVTETRYANALAQTIILENRTDAAGQNLILVRAYGPMGRDAGVGTLPDDRITMTTIRRELRERFPGTAMEVSGLYAQNRYGPFSYATGRTPSGTNCVYAWQRIAAEPALISTRRGAVTWRLRVCDGRTDTRTLLLLAYGLTTNGYFLSKRWNPYGDPPPPDPRIGVPGATIIPEQAVDPTVVAPSSFHEAARPVNAAPRRGPAASRPSRRQPAVEAAQPRVLNRPVEGAAVVPRPQDTDLTEPDLEGSNLPEAGLTAGEAPPPIVGDDIRVPRPPGPDAAPSAPTTPTVPTPTVPGTPTVPVPLPEEDASRVELPDAGAVRRRVVRLQPR